MFDARPLIIAHLTKSSALHAIYRSRLSFISETPARRSPRCRKPNFILLITGKPNTQTLAPADVLAPGKEYAAEAGILAEQLSPPTMDRFRTTQREQGAAEMIAGYVGRQGQGMLV